MTMTLRRPSSLLTVTSWVQLVPADAEEGPRQASSHRAFPTDWTAAFSGYSHAHDVAQGWNTRIQVNFSNIDLQDLGMNSEICTAKNGGHTDTLQVQSDPGF